MRQAIFISILLTNMALGLNRAFAGDVPLEPNAFTAVVGDLFRHAIPGSEVTVSGPLSLKIVLSKDGNVDSHTAYLKSLHDLCVRDPGNCDASVRYHITDIATYYAHNDDNLDPKALRIAVRTSAHDRGAATLGRECAARASSGRRSMGRGCGRSPDHNTDAETGRSPDA